MSDAPETTIAAVPSPQPWAAHRFMFFKGQFDTRIATGEDYATQSLAKIFTMAAGDKPKGAGLACIPSAYCDYDGREHSAQRERGRYIALTADIDSGDHDLETLRAAVTLFTEGAAWLIYSSPHARPGDMRWRVLLPLIEEQPFEAWHDGQLAFYAFLTAQGIECDHALARAAQPVYLPNVPELHAKSETRLRGDDGKPLYFVREHSGTDKPALDITAGLVAKGIAALRLQRLEDEQARDAIRREAEARRAITPRGDGTSLIDDFNAENTVATLLELCGYEQCPRSAEDWRSPHQTGDTYATRVIGSKWVSLSASDTSAGLGEKFSAGCFGDAYDLYVHFKHGGDHKSAYRALGAEKRAAQGNVVYPKQFDPPDWLGEVPGYDEMPEWAEAGVTPHEAQYSGDFDGGVTPQDNATALPLIDIAQWIGNTPPDRIFAWGDMIPLGTTTMLTGPGGVGKSLFEQMLCTCIALGLPFLGAETREMNTLYVTCEDDAEELWRRQVSICAVLKVPLQAVIGKLYLVSLCGENDTALATFNDKEQIERTTRWAQLVETCLQHKIQLYAFDNATDAMAGDLNSIHQVAEFVNLLTGLAILLGGAAMILHHPNKAGDDWLGSVAWHNKVRSRMIIKRSEVEGDEDGRILENPKANYGPSGGKIMFRWHKGAFMADRDMPDDYAAQLSETIAASGANEAFLRCLRSRSGQPGRDVGPKMGPSYAPARFAEMPEARGFEKKALAGAMERLLTLGFIVTEEAFNSKARRYATVIREVL